MSHQDAHDLDCADVVEAVYLYLDGELAGDAIEDIKRHLDECSPCLREYGVEQEVKAIIARSCCESAPEQLRVAIQQRIEVVRSQMTSAEYTEVTVRFSTD
jgi:mycothiol system anti-sigma-R factor